MSEKPHRCQERSDSADASPEWRLRVASWTWPCVGQERAAKLLENPCARCPINSFVNYEVAVAKKPQMILNSEEMEQMYETNPEEAAKYVFVSKMPGEASWKTDAQRAAEAAASSSQHLRK